ncbi:hypothetical protein Ahy_A07g032747 [Arachis hypogaea]|uniref:Aminotransferase-like plant mobile domain-containing protein n=1 Tax=Arachis hypogaea TaxID=3818 RepID=A0A445C7L0_ARAHY|nr:hypothetical protein Ahy_A07g032747 [Arachis hypogaea]
MCAKKEEEEEIYVNLNEEEDDSSRNTRYLHQIDSYAVRVEAESSFYHISHIRRIMSHTTTIDALVERCRLETHTFHLPHDKCTITLEDVTMIFRLQTDSLPVIGSIDHSTSGLENECMTQFGSAHRLNNHRRSGINKLAWFRTLKRHQHLTDQIRMPSIGPLPMDTNFSLARK